MDEMIPYCYLCPLPVSGNRDFDTNDYCVVCKRCGRYRVSFELSFELSEKEKPLWALSAATRQAFNRGSILRLDRDNWLELAQAHTSTPVREKIRLLIEFYARHSKYAGDVIRLNKAMDYPLFDAVSDVECSYLLDQTIKSNLVEDCSNDLTRLSTQGWEQVERLASSGAVAGRCFIAMSFDPALDEAYSLAIKPAILECGFDPVCMKEIMTNEGITDRILSEVRLAQFVVADFTGQRGGVYFEAGFARGLGRPVIWCCRKDELEKVHFDIKHYGHVVWDDKHDLRSKLAQSIRANIIPER